MSEEHFEFRRPVLNVVVADDQVPWIDTLEDHFAKQISDWALYTTGQFKLATHRCESSNELKSTVELLLDKGELVYATVDIKMPANRGGVPTAHGWSDTVSWCLKRCRDQGHGQRFEFCVISGEERELDELFKHQQHGVELERKGIKRAYKHQIRSSKDAHLARIWQDIRAFVLKHIHFCTVPDGTKAETMVWFGADEGLASLLARTDEIVSKKTERGELFMIFADSGGFEEDWFRLCCHLRGVTAPTILDFRSLSRRDDAWQSHISTPPAALMLNNVVDSWEKGFPIHDEMESTGFLDRIDDAGTFACIQFPEFPTELAARFDVEELKILTACLTKVYRKEPPFDAGAGFPYADHRQIVRLPSFARLRRAGAVNATIAFQVELCQSRYANVSTASLEPELRYVLGEMRWDDDEDGIDSLRLAIDRAYAKANTQADRSTRSIAVSAFHRHGSVHECFHSAEGFAIRGRRLVQLLDPIHSPKHPQRASEFKDISSAEALEGLNTIHSLFQSLEQLVALYLRLQEKGSVEFREDFPSSDFEALKKSHEFLRQIFQTPAILAEQIEAFRLSVSSRAWRDAYPSLDVREDWGNLIEHVRFTWPNSRFRLPQALDDYLRRSGVVADIYLEMETVLPRYPQLQEAWTKNKVERQQIEQKVQACELQRRNAERFAREEFSQPVLVALAPADGEPRPSLYVTLQAFFLFNALVAVCENCFRFNGKIIERKHVRGVLETPQLGTSIHVLRHYLAGLRTHDKLRGSYFERWTDNWHAERQSDAPRVVATMVDRILSDDDFRRSVTPEELREFSVLKDFGSGGGRCPPDLFLGFLNYIRKSMDKQAQSQFLDRHEDGIRDSLRRFVYSTSKPKFFFGRVAEDGLKAQLWSRDTVVEVAIAESTAHAAKTCILVHDDKTYRPLFPIDDVIRVVPADARVVAHYDKERWVDLIRGGVIARGPDASYLPESLDRLAIWQWLKDKEATV